VGEEDFVMFMSEGGSSAFMMAIANLNLPLVAQCRLSCCEYG
jgi:hypothetical protein